jgi:glycosyltransferase involved in cell wall biosynthesis
MDDPRAIVMLSTADWDNPFWTNKQHVAVELARRGHPILYIESVGLRRPTASARDARRIVARLKRALAGVRQVRPNIWVLSPPTIPSQGSRRVRMLNRLILRLLIARACRSLGLSRPWLWTYNPITTEVLDLRSFERVIYHCVDEIAAQPGMPFATIAASERELVRRADIVFVTSEALFSSRRELRSDVHYLPNVADFDHFAKAREDATAIPADIAALRKPVFGFVGAISDYKVDYGLLRAVARARPQWSIVLIGLVGEGEPGSSADELKSEPNIHLLGPRDYNVLPQYLKAFDVAILPSRLNPYTKAMFPMKFFEYLAAGRPVISTRLPALREFQGVATFVDTPDEFVAAGEAMLAGQVPPLSERLELASQHTYAQRTSRMLTLIGEAPSPASR